MNLLLKTCLLCSACLILSFCAPLGRVGAQARLGEEGADWTQLRSYQKERAPIVSGWDEKSADAGRANPLLGVGVVALVGAGTGLLYGVHVDDGVGAGFGAILGLTYGAFSGGTVWLADRGVRMNWWRGLLVGGVVGGVLTYLAGDHWGFEEDAAARFIWLMPIPGMAAGGWLARQRDQERAEDRGR